MTNKIEKSLNNGEVLIVFHTDKAAYVWDRLNDVFGIGRWSVKIDVASEEKGFINENTNTTKR